MSRRQCSSRSERPTIRERGEYADGNGLRRVVTVHSATRQQRRDFKTFAAKHGLTLAGDFSGHELSAFDVVGADADVFALLQQPFVKGWEYATNARITNVALGTGADKRTASKQREQFRELERNGEVDRLSFLLFVYGADYPRLPLLPTEFNAVSPLLDNAERWTLFVQVHADYILDKKSNATDMDSLRYWLACERKLADWKRDKKIPNAPIRPDRIGYSVHKTKDGEEIASVSTTPRVRPSTYASEATMQRHDTRNATRPATKDSERDAWVSC